MQRYENPPYYITAYGLAVKRGYKGTLDEWLASLQGQKGDKVELRNLDGMIQWRWIPDSGADEEGAGEWQDLIDISAAGGSTGGADGEDGTDGEDGANGSDGSTGKDSVTFTPNVDSEGNLSWSNNGGLDNPETVNIKGKDGMDGATVDEVLAAMPVLTAVDFSNFDSGSFVETIDGLAVTHAVTFDDSGRPITIGDIAITWGD